MEPRLRNETVLKAMDHREGLARAREALIELYRYYGRTERMCATSYRDEAEVPALQEPMRQFRNYLVGIGNDLAEHLEPELDATNLMRATLAHAIQFRTWQSLAWQGLDDAVMRDLVSDGLGRWALRATSRLRTGIENGRLVAERQNQWR